MYPWRTLEVAGGRSAIGERSQRCADFSASLAEFPDPFGQDGAPDPLQVVEGGCAVDGEALRVAEADLGRDVTDGARERRDDDSGQDADGLGAGDDEHRPPFLLRLRP